MPFSQNKQSAFSLLELLVTLAVLGILLTVGLPSFKQMKDRNSLQGGTDALYFVLSLAKVESMKRNQNVFIRIISGDQWCVGLNEMNSVCDCNTPNSCDVAEVSHSDYSNLTLSTDLIMPHFDRVRGSFSEPDKGFKLLSESGREVQLTINLLGGVRLCGVDGALGLYDC